MHLVSAAMLLGLLLIWLLCNAQYLVAITAGCELLRLLTLAIGGGDAQCPFTVLEAVVVLDDVGVIHAGQQLQITDKQPAQLLGYLSYMQNLLLQNLAAAKPCCRLVFVW
jgi:hypothetical protein